jgi:uncharacterized coiled-coil DUF342 family protein
LKFPLALQVYVQPGEILIRGRQRKVAKWLPQIAQILEGVKSEVDTWKVTSKDLVMRISGSWAEIMQRYNVLLKWDSIEEVKEDSDDYHEFKAV